MQINTPIFKGKPLIIMIERLNDVWDISASSTEPSPNGGGRTHRDEMKIRAHAMNSVITNNWGGRRAGGAPDQPHFKEHPDHVPVVVVPGEKVQFRCENNLPFAIWVERDPNVTVVPTSPNNPFGFYLPQNYNNGVSPVMEVLPNIEGQRFYKCTAWINVGEGKTVVVDPDVIGDGN